VLLERVDVHARPVLRHRLDDDTADEFQQPLLAVVLPTAVALPLAFLALLPPPFALRAPLLFLGLLFRRRRRLHLCALFCLFLRGRRSGDDRRRFGL
jgi:hypothetical protein